MSIVIITIPGEAKRVFANSLHKITGENVKLVIIQKPKPNHHSFIKRIGRLYKSVGLLALPIEIFYAILLRLNKSTKNTLEYFRERSETISTEAGYLPKTIETISANSDEVFEVLKKLMPDIIVIWGNTIVKPHILKTAKRAVNLHMGLCPYYRGAIANQHAVINYDLERIGATIHYAEEKVDTGNILETITADHSKSPRELFRDVNDRAEEKYLNVVQRLFNGEDLEQRPQDTSKSQNLKLKDWTPSTRYNLAKQIMKWEKTGILA
ncbi:MAG: formyltransferase family protein [bacterium]|nr:formyltransferase family protein [bacterium]